MGWHVATTCHLRRLFIFLCIIGGTYIYVPICVHTNKDTWYRVISSLVPEVSFLQLYFLFDGPGMSFVEGIVCPHASQTCCDIFSKNNLINLIFLYHTTATLLMILKPPLSTVLTVKPNKQIEKYQLVLGINFFNKNQAQKAVLEHCIWLFHLVKNKNELFNMSLQNSKKKSFIRTHNSTFWLTLTKWTKTLSSLFFREQHESYLYFFTSYTQTFCRRSNNWEWLLNFFYQIAKS